MYVNLSVRNIILTVLVIITTSIGLFYGGMEAARHNQALTQPATAPSPATATAPPSAATLASGTSNELGQDAPAYSCSDHLESVQVPIGETIKRDGGEYKLKASYFSYGDQKQVHVSVKMPHGISAPAMIVNTGDHNLYPRTYPQYLMQIKLGAGDTGSYLLKTDAYVNNMMVPGITDVTFCVTRN